MAQLIGTAERIVAQLFTAVLAVCLSALLTWIFSFSLAIGWIGIGLVTLSLPMGPALAVTATRLLFRASPGPRILAVVLGTWIGAIVALTLCAFGPQQWPWVHQELFAVLVGGLLGAQIGASFPRTNGARDEQITL